MSYKAEQKQPGLVRNNRLKLQKHTGEILRIARIEVEKETRRTTYQLDEYAVLLSTEKEFVVENKMGGFSIYDRKKQSYNANTLVGSTNCYEQKWNMKSFPDKIIATSISFYSRKINENRVKKCLADFLKKEYSFYEAMVTEVLQSIDDIMKISKQ